MPDPTITITNHDDHRQYHTDPDTAALLALAQRYDAGETERHMTGERSITSFVFDHARETGRMLDGPAPIREPAREIPTSRDAADTLLDQPTSSMSTRESDWPRPGSEASRTGRFSDRSLEQMWRDDDRWHDAHPGSRGEALDRADRGRGIDQ